MTIHPAHACIGVDIGGTNLRFALVDETGAILIRDRRQTEIGQGKENFLDRLVAGGRLRRLRKWLGDKTKGGFYKKIKTSGQEDERLALDWKTLEYRPRQKAKFPALDMAKNVEETGARLRMLLGLEGAGPQKSDKAGAFLWSALSDLWNYSADRVPEVSDSIVEIDRAMKLGFNWEIGPFEMWDAAGVEATVARMKKEGRAVATIAAGRLVMRNGEVY